MTITTWLQTRKAHWTLIIVSILSSIIGVLLLGHTLESAARLILGLEDHNPAEFILPIVGAIIMLSLGTVILTLAFQIKNNKMRLILIIITIGFSMLLEIADLTIRFISIVNDYMKLVGL